MEKVLSGKENFISLKTAQSGSDFVGIRISGTERTITFPMGYVPQKQTLSAEKIEKQERKEILNLIQCISRCSSGKKGEIVSLLDGKTLNAFPVRAMIFIIEDFLDRNAYYTEKETLYTKNTSGKINWMRTVKNIEPVVTETGIAFLDFIIRKNRIQENQLITELHKYCVYKSFELMGFLFTPMLPERGILQESDVSKNKKYYAQFLQDKIDTTHLESNIELFTNMLDLINNYDSESDVKEAAYGTNCFQVVWESLIEKAFGTATQREKEKYFYPASLWNFADGNTKTNHPLRPDTIMIQGEKCFILDAKYYSYDMLRTIETGDENEQETVLIHGSIPGSDSIQKQITYAEYIDCSINNNGGNFSRPAKFRFAPENIYNVFVLPANNGEKVFDYKGYATSEWKDNTKNYHFVHAITVDAKWLMECAGKNITVIKSFVLVIEESGR